MLINIGNTLTILFFVGFILLVFLLLFKYFKWAKKLVLITRNSLHQLIVVCFAELWLSTIIQLRHVL